MTKVSKFFILILSISILLSADFTLAERLKDISSIRGVRENQLVGYGLVVGLQGSGDRSYKSPFTTQALISMLKRLGANIELESLQDGNSIQQKLSALRHIRVENVAAVIVTASLPPFARAGQRIDINVASLGDARSLEGGQLLMTPLKGANQEIYAVGQGSIVSSLQSDNTVRDIRSYSRRSSKILSAMIPGGALVEKEVGFNILNEPELIFALTYPDFTTVNRAVGVINETVGSDVAKALDSTAFSLSFPDEYQDRKIEYIALVESLQVESDSQAKIVINEKSGAIVIGSNVTIDGVAITHENLTIKIENPSQENSAQYGNQNGKNSKFVELQSNRSLSAIVESLNELGIATKDIILIFQALRRAGALKATIEII
ncbi:MAG: flagellar basal body P-ring protein FlgI [Nitrospinota bacterium]